MWAAVVSNVFRLQNVSRQPLRAEDGRLVRRNESAGTLPKRSQQDVWCGIPHAACGYPAINLTACTT